MDLPLVTNVQPVEKKDYQEDGSLEVVSIFPTLQGEGPFAGTPAVFVRLAGCNLTCDLCDTDYTTGRKRASPAEISAIVKIAAGDPVKLVVITGGEPFRQNLKPLVILLIQSGYRVQVETNGSLAPPGDGVFSTSFGDHWVWSHHNFSIVCSPKTAKVHPAMVLISPVAWKYIVQAGHTDPEDGLPTRVLGHDCRVARPPQHSRVYVQPQDDKDEAKNKANTEEALRVCLKYGYVLSLQMHKMLGLE